VVFLITKGLLNNIITMGVIKGSKRGPYNKTGIKEIKPKKVKTIQFRKPRCNKYTDEEIIEVISKYETRGEIRESLNSTYYYLAIRRGLSDFLPPKRTKSGIIVGTSLELKLKQREEKELLRRLKKEQQQLKKIKKSENIDTKSLIMFPMINVEGKNFCGRCHIVDLEVDCSGNKNLCSLCYSRKNYLISRGRYSNLFNVKDEYCHTIIKHHEKVFEIGLKVDDKTENYLSMIGYEFIFKENS